jgi:hypothetical protein
MIQKTQFKGLNNVNNVVNYVNNVKNSDKTMINYDENYTVSKTKTGAKYMVSSEKNTKKWLIRLISIH